MDINKQKLKYRILATILTLSVLLSSVAVFVIDSYADYLEDSLPSDCICMGRFKFTDSEGDGFRTYYIKSSNYDISKACWLKLSDGSGRLYVNGGLDNTYYTTSRSSNVYRRSTVYSDLYPWTLLDGGCYYIFSNEDKAQAYIAGTLSEDDIKKYAINYDELQNAKLTNTYDATLPFYDKTNILVNTANDGMTATYTASMSSDQLALYQSGFNEDGSNPYVLELHTYAIYASVKALGTYNDFVLNYGVGNKLENMLPNNKKMSELIRYDASDRLLIKEYAGSGATNKCLYDDFMVVDSSSSLMASRQKNISPIDGVSASPTYTIDITPADKTIGNLQDTEGRFDLIGYAVVIAVSKKGEDGNYITGNCSYSYAWKTKAIADRYGNKSESYTPEGTQISGSSSYFDKTTGESVDPIGSSSTLDDSNVMQYIQNGFGLLGNNGMIALFQTVFLGIPVYIWTLIGMLIGVNIILIVFKVTRGF